MYSTLFKWTQKVQCLNNFLRKSFGNEATSCSTSPVKTAILMLNMGGPEKTCQVHDYLNRIMTDRDMIQLPFQSKLGPWIAKRRTPEVQKKYCEIGGGSPILEWTCKQGKLLCEKLDCISPETAPHKPYVGFRYVTPLTEEALIRIEQDKPERVVLFSQYPQYSCATSGSSFNAIYTHYKNKTVPSSFKWSVIERWSTHPLLAKVFAERIKDKLCEIEESKRKDTVIIFSAHSLPLKAVCRGDPYPSEVGATVQRVMDELNQAYPYCLTWQSKVGPLTWLEPATDAALKGFVKKGKKNFILVPIAFVNEHIETLHEMDIEYCIDLAKKLKVQKMLRAAAPNDHPIFIEALSDIVKSHLKKDSQISPKFLLLCPHCKSKNCRDSKKWYSKLST